MAKSKIAVIKTPTSKTSTVMKKTILKRLTYIAKWCKGRTLDIGFAETPNPFLQYPDGLDITISRIKPTNYAKLFKRDLNKAGWFKGLPAYDTIAAGEVIEHLENPSVFLRGCYARLRAGGLLVLTTPNPLGLKNVLDVFRGEKAGRQDHISMLPPICIKRLLRYNGFKLINVTGFGIHIPFLNRTIGSSPDFSGIVMYVAKKIQREK